MDTFNISRLAIFLVVVGMLASIIVAKATSESQEVNVADTPGVTVTNPQTLMPLDSPAANPVPFTGSPTVDNTGPTTVKARYQAGECSRYQARVLEAECTALRNTLILRIFLALR